MSEEHDDETEGEIRELSQEIIKHGLLMNEYLEDLLTEYQGDGVQLVVIDELQKAYNNAEDPRRKQRVAMFTIGFGQRNGSEKIANHGKEMLEEWNEEFGGE